jgi:hypothetical protein
MRRALRAALTGAAALTIVGVAPRNAAAQQACKTPKTTCSGHSGYYAPSEDIDRLTAVADPILRDVRTCLDGVGARHVASALVIRWDSDGKPVDVKIDVPGYESLPCVQKAHAKISTLQNPRETAIRCEFGCPQPPAPKPAPAPVVVAPPAPTQPAPVVTAPAPTPPPAKVEAPQYEKVWYGYQTLIADGISFGTLVGGIASRSGGVTTAGYLGFLFVTPIIHMVHGNVGPGFGSIGIRFLLPLMSLGVGAIAGLIVGGSSGGGFDKFANGASGAVNGAVIGGLIGVGGCVAIDAAGFAYRKERVDSRSITRGPRRPQPWFTLAPSLDVQKDRAAFGVAGQF